MPQRIDTPTRSVSSLHDLGEPSSRSPASSRSPISSRKPASMRGSNDPRVGQVLAGRYQLLSRLGDGATGNVYLADHISLRRKVAVKILHADLSQNQEIVARFEREAVAGANIDHPNVAAAFDYGSQSDGTFFLALEYIEGRCLRDELDGPLPLERALHIAEQIAAALERAHALGIVHRDLKPENIMLVDRHGDPDFVKVLDFGVARVRLGEEEEQQRPSDRPLTRAGMVYGTPEYMAPEQAIGEAVDARADVYALGIMLFEMLAGVRPFRAESMVMLLGMQVTAAFPFVRDIAPQVEVPAEVEALLRSLTQKNASDRPADGGAVAQAFAALQGGTRPSARYSLLGQRAPAPLSSRPPTAPAARARLPAQLDDKLEQLSRWTAPLWSKLPVRLRNPNLLIGAAGALGSALAVFLLIKLLAPKPNQATSSSTSTASAQPQPPAPSGAALIARALANGQLEQARQQLDSSRLDPKQTVALRQDLARGFFRSGRRVEAFRQLETLYNLDPQSTELGDLAEEIERALIEPSYSSLAFAYFEGHPNHLGADVLYKIVAEGRASRPVLDRANRMLQNPFVREHASPAVLIAYDLRAAGQYCAKLRDLLPRARDLGDARALHYLYAAKRPVIVTKKTGLFRKESTDLLACLHRDRALADTIETIETRVGKKPPNDAAP